MGVRSKIPGRDQIWRNLFTKSLAVASEGGSVLLEVEWPNGEITFEPARIDEEQNRYVCKNGMTFFSRGKGSDPCTLAGQKVIRVRAENAGCISTYHALMSTAMTDGTAIPVDEDGNELVEVEAGKFVHADALPTDEEGNPRVDEVESVEALADGGYIAEPADFVARAPEGTDGMEYSLAESTYHDPEPVSQEDTRRAVEQAQIAEKDMGELIKYVGYGFVFGLLPVIILVILIWILGQLGGGGGGGSTISFGMLAAVSTRSLFASRLSEVDDE